MLKHDPIPWLLKQEGEAAVRARCSLGLEREGDDEDKRTIVERLAASQFRDGSFDHSPMKSAGIVCLLADLGQPATAPVVSRVAEFLFGVLQSQPGSHRCGPVRPGTLTTPCDLGGFFGPYETRNEAHVMADGAREMNFYREYEPLLGPKSPVRPERRSSLDKAGPASCYAWGLVPLCYIVEALSRGGFGGDPRLEPAISVLLGAQRESGGWCRNLGGHPNCTLPVLRALGACPRPPLADHVERALEFMGGSWQETSLFSALHAVAPFSSPTARTLIRSMLAKAGQRQQRNGTFGRPCQIERVAAVLRAMQSLEKAEEKPNPVARTGKGTRRPRDPGGSGKA